MEIPCPLLSYSARSRGKCGLQRGLPRVLRSAGASGRSGCDSRSARRCISDRGGGGTRDALRAAGQLRAPGAGRDRPRPRRSRSRSGRAAAIVGIDDRLPERGIVSSGRCASARDGRGSRGDECAHRGKQACPVLARHSCVLATGTPAGVLSRGAADLGRRAVPHHVGVAAHQIRGKIREHPYLGRLVAGRRIDQRDWRTR